MQGRKGRREIYCLSVCLNIYIPDGLLVEMMSTWKTMQLSVK